MLIFIQYYIIITVKYFVIILLDKPRDFELRILYKLNSIDSKVIEVILRFLGYFGTLFFWFLGIGYFILVGVWTSPPHILIYSGFGAEPFIIASLLTAGMIIDLIITNLLQYLFKRDRPYKNLTSNTDKKLKVRSWEMTPSFPSAHVHRSFLGVTLLAWSGFEWGFFLYIFNRK